MWTSSSTTFTHDFDAENGPYLIVHMTAMLEIYRPFCHVDSYDAHSFDFLTFNIVSFAHPNRCNTFFNSALYSSQNF